MLEVSYTAIRQMYNTYKQRAKFYVDWQNILSHDDVNTAQVGCSGLWSLGLL